jgi:hypothetical protein
MLLQWGIEQAERSGHPIYLESTMEAVPFYEKRGFIKGARMSLDISGKGDLEGVQIYEEVGVVYRPLALDKDVSQQDKSMSDY